MLDYPTLVFQIWLDSLHRYGVIAEKPRVSRSIVSMFPCLQRRTPWPIS